MIEVTFTESAGGSLKQAFSFGKGSWYTPAIAVIGSNEDGTPFTDEQIQEETRRVEEEYRNKWENAVQMEGNPKDVFCLSLGLSLGDISGDVFGTERTEFLQRMICIPGEEFSHVAEEQISQCRHDRDAILRRAADGEPVRIWYSNYPDEMCGLFHLLSILPLNSEIYSVKLPVYKDFPEEKSVHSHTGWGEVLPEHVHRFLSLEEKISENAHRMYRTHWHRLVLENAPVRAILNGKLVSAGEELYDFSILLELEKREEIFHEAHFIGDILGKYQLGISDWFIHARIEVLISKGILSPLSEAPAGYPVYHRELQKNR